MDEHSAQWGCGQASHKGASLKAVPPSRAWLPGADRTAAACLHLHRAALLQSCLLDQKFVLDDSVTVQQLLKNKAQQLGLPGALGCWTV